eukprot:364403-Chlamydomonas_euryale.AAC.3
MDGRTGCKLGGQKGPGRKDIVCTLSGFCMTERRTNPVARDKASLRAKTPDMLWGDPQGCFGKCPEMLRKDPRDALGRDTSLLHETRGWGVDKLPVYYPRSSWP